MPKSIYYDENGNEQILSSSPSALSGLLDTDITTPQPNQVLAYDGDNWVNSDICKITQPNPNITIGSIGKNSSYVMNRIVGLTLRIQTSAGANVFTQIGSVTEKPVDEVRAPFVLSGSGAYGGMVKITDSGNIEIFPISAISSANIDFSLTYLKAL